MSDTSKFDTLSSDLESRLDELFREDAAPAVPATPAMAPAAPAAPRQEMEVGIQFKF